MNQGDKRRTRGKREEFRGLDFCPNSDYESGGQEFESSRARHPIQSLNFSSFGSEGLVCSRFAKLVRPLFSNFAIAISARYLARGRYFSRIELIVRYCAR